MSLTSNDIDVGNAVDVDVNVDVEVNVGVEVSVVVNVGDFDVGVDEKKCRIPHEQMHISRISFEPCAIINLHHHHGHIEE